MPKGRSDQDAIIHGRYSGMAEFPELGLGPFYVENLKTRFTP